MKNCKKYLVADALLNYSKNSITEFIETSKDSELSKIAEEKGIVLPSPDLMLFRTIYAKLGEPNRNGVIINREPVEKSLKTLISKQINLEHEGKNFVCGHILDAKLENEYIVIYGVFYKSLFQEEYETLKELFTDKKVYVSFEIWSRDPETGKSVIHDLEDGTREINPVLFHGCGLLMQHLPACKEAVLDKILGKKELENAEQIINKVFNEDLIYASFDYEESKCMNCKTCSCDKEKEEKIVEEIKVEELVAEKLCPECQQPLKEDEKDLCAVCLKKKDEEKNKSSEETQVVITPAETKTEEKSEVVETKTEEIKTEETKEEIAVVKDEASVVIQTQEVIKTDELKPDVEIITTEVKTETTSKDDSGVVTMVVVRDEKTVETYTRQQLTEEVKIAQEEIVAALPKEVSDRIKELMKDGKSMKEAMKQAWEEYKKSQEKALEEKDVEIKNKNTELEQKTQEIAKLTVVEEPKTEKIMTVGSVETERVSETKKQANKINEIIASKHKQ